ncbi:MAG: type IX secretion system outer membrane channel protein PorV [Flavobacteriales bacterium]|nr:type IX secretion system outer membrane channel protein PorV [Flavobacteriales bacterium]
MNNIITSAIAVFISMNSFAQPTSGGATDKSLQLNTITTAVPFMSITPDSRAGGMGDAGTALSANSNSIYWNTAIMNFSEAKGEVSVSYTPWLRQLTNDIHLSYVSAYTQLGDRHSIAGALRYFSLGSITYTGTNGDVIRDGKPSEYEITGGYAFQTSKRTSVGLNGKFAYSNLTQGLPVQGVESKAAIVGAADISFAFFNDQAKIGSLKGSYTFGATINNVGNKVKYSDLGATTGDFAPMNLKLGNAFKADIDKYNSITLAVDLQKLLVPTPELTKTSSGYSDLGEDRVGYSNDIGVIAGMMQSFYDAPGQIERDDADNLIQNEDGSYQIVKGSRFKEEISEINIATGLEYWYNNVFALRAGFFYENKNKGSRQYFNLGIGFKYNKFGVDISYLAALKKTNPLANTLRFSLRFELGDSNKPSVTETP